MLDAQTHAFRNIWPPPCVPSVPSTARHLVERYNRKLERGDAVALALADLFGS